MKILMVCATMVLLCSCETARFEKGVVSKEIREDGILKEIDDFQKRYWKIVKRKGANVLLNVCPEDYGVEKDIKELSNLYAEVENKIDKNNPWLKIYNKLIMTKLGPSDNGVVDSMITTYDMIRCSSGEFIVVDTLLNQIYRPLKFDLSSNGLKKLEASQRLWLKEVKNYNKIYDSESRGTIGPVLLAEARINMHKFRVLLLMLCAQQKEKAK